MEGGNVADRRGSWTARMPDAAWAGAGREGGATSWHGRHPMRALPHDDVSCNHCNPWAGMASRADEGHACRGGHACMQMRGMHAEEGNA